MLREFKFRAWDKTNNGMLYEGFGILSIGLIFGHTNLEKIVDYKNLEIMQFTGFLDKNGKDIYEGDIVKSKDRYLYSGGYEIYVVEWQEKVKNHNDYPNEISGYLIGRDAEIIGNIYENPELLTT